MYAELSMPNEGFGELAMANPS